MPKRVEKEVPSQAPENEFEEAVAETKGKIVKKTPLMKKFEAFISAAGVTEKVIEAEERLIEPQWATKEGEKIPVIFATFVDGRTDILECLWTITTTTDKLLFGYGVEVIVDELILGFYKQD